MKIFLVGYMGSGKTKVGEALAKILNYSFVDTDKLIQNKTGLSISEIFSKNGEEKFRELETLTLREFENQKHLVIATGGGLPIHSDNMNWMNKNGITVYLEAGVGLLYHRLAVSKKGRPLVEHLTDIELMEQISSHLVQRLPIYKLATIKINAQSLDLKELTEKVKKQIKVSGIN